MTDAVSAFDCDPMIEPKAFRSCLGQFATGVTVVTTEVDGEKVGLTANSFASVSLSPPLVLWSIGMNATSFKTFERADRFAINVLAEDQILLSKHFGRSGHDKFASVEWTGGKHGLPILVGVAAFFECDVASRHQGGDHLIMVGHVRRAVQFDRKALVFAQGRYRVTGDHPEEGVFRSAS